MSVKVLDDSELYISLNKNKCDKGKTSLSWADIFEDELGDSIESKPITTSIDNSSSLFRNKPKITRIDKILELDYKKMGDVTLLQYEAYLSSQLRSMSREYDKKEDIVLDPIIVPILEWIKEVSGYLSSRLNLEDIKLTHDNNGISRSSYNFCSHSYECQYNYNNTGNKGCYLQHYVHNFVSADIDEILRYLNNRDSYDFKEIKTSLNTLSYVVNHMYEELSHVEYFNNGKSNLMHKNKLNLSKSRDNIKKRRRYKKKNKKN